MKFQVYKNVHPVLNFGVSVKRCGVLLVALLAAVSSLAMAAGNPEAGKAKVAVCGACHGMDGNSLVAIYPKLAGQGESYLLKQLKEIKSKTRNVIEMTGLLDAMTDEDLENIAAYYASQQMKPGAAKKDLVNMGQKIYRAGNPATGVAACSGCHSPTGEGIASAAFPKLGSQYPEYVTSQLKMFREGKRDNDPNGMMRGVASRLSDKEIEAVASYVSGLRK